MLCQNQPQQHSFTLHESMVSRYHTHPVSSNQCSSTVIQTIDAPIGLVWSVVRRFDNPQAYKHFIRSCSTNDDGSIGSVREVRIVSGLPAGTSTERLDALDDDGHVISFSIVGGDHRLSNYRSTTTLHEIRGEGGEARPRTVVIESYVVDVPPGNTREDTCVFADTIVRFNLRSLAEMSEKLARATAAA